MTKINSTDRKILKTIRKYNMISNGDRVLVGLSGGKDSVALLYSLNRISSIIDFELIALHVNHSIRGAEADKDEEFAKDFCEKLSVKFFSVRVDVPSESKNSDEGLEAVARKMRYEQFSYFAENYNCNKIATAHTASDNSETYFITLLRNGNAKGIPPVRDNIIRPLIDLTSEDVIGYCNEMGLSYVFDSTNEDESYTRNCIRKKIIPELKKINSSIDECIAKDSDIKRSYEALCNIELNRYYSCEQNPMGLTSLIKLTKNFAYKNVLFAVIQRQAFESKINISYPQFLQIESLITKGKKGRFVELENGFVAYRDYNEIVFKKRELSSHSDYNFEIKLGENRIPDSNIVLYFETVEDYLERQKKNEQTNTKINKLSKNVLIKYNIIDTSLYARSRCTGDSYIINGMTKKIKKYMIDAKIPSNIRSKIPVVCDSEGIVWVPGLGVADRLKECEGKVYSLCVNFINQAVERAESL